MLKNYKKEKILFLLIFLFSCFALESNVSDIVYFEASGAEAKWVNHNAEAGAMKLTNDKENTIFLTSSLGNGYQAKLKKTQKDQYDNYISPVITKLANKIGTIACQSPLGTRVECVTECGDSLNAVNPYRNTKCSNKTTGFTVDFATIEEERNAQNFLNESPNNQDLDYTYLDTIINNTDYTFKIAVTTMPFNELKNFINAGTLLRKNILNQAEIVGLKGESYSLGDKYKIKALSVGSDEKDFTFQKGTRRHMVQKDLALTHNFSDSESYQTIILYPPIEFNPIKPEAKQPMLLIGSDNRPNNISIAVVVSGEFLPSDAEGNKKDKILKELNVNSTEGYKTMLNMSNIKPYKPARLGIIINPTFGQISEVTDEGEKISRYFGEITKVEALSGLWIPEISKPSCKDFSV